MEGHIIGLLSVISRIETAASNHQIKEMEDKVLLLGGRIGIMSAGPSSKITHIYDVPLAYPRDMSAPEFHALYNRIQAHFEE